MEDRKAIDLIAERERRDSGYVASLLVEWAIEQYAIVGASFPALWESKAVRDANLTKKSRERLALRREAQYLNASVPKFERQRKRA